MKVAEHDGRGFMAAGGTEYYRMSVAGVASLNGRLDVTLDHMNYVPSPSDAFVVLSADSLTGAFANVANG